MTWVTMCLVVHTCHGKYLNSLHIWKCLLAGHPARLLLDIGRKDSREYWLISSFNVCGGIFQLTLDSGMGTVKPLYKGDNISTKERKRSFWHTDRYIDREVNLQVQKPQNSQWSIPKWQKIINIFRKIT